MRSTGPRTESRCCSIHFVSANESYLWVYDLATREKREIEPSKVKAARGGNFSRDGKGVYFTSDLGSEFRTLRYVDLATRQGHAAHRPHQVGHR